MLREERADNNYKVVNRQRSVFVEKDLPYSIDIYNNLYGQDKLYILRFNNAEGKDPASLIPEWIKVQKDVRADKQYSLRRIAKI